MDCVEFDWMGLVVFCCVSIVFLGKFCLLIILVIL